MSLKSRIRNTSNKKMLCTKLTLDLTDRQLFAEQFSPEGWWLEVLSDVMILITQLILLLGLGRIPGSGLAGYNSRVAGRIERKIICFT